MIQIDSPFVQELDFVSATDCIPKKQSIIPP